MTSAYQLWTSPEYKVSKCVSIILTWAYLTSILKDTSLEYQNNRNVNNVVSIKSADLFVSSWPTARRHFILIIGKSCPETTVYDSYTKVLFIFTPCGYIDNVNNFHLGVCAQNFPLRTRHHRDNNNYSCDMNVAFQW